MLHCLTRKTHQSSPPADGNSRLPWNGSSTAQWNEKMLGVQESKGLTMPQTYHFDSRCIVWFHHCVRHLWRRDHGEGFHNASVVRSSEKMSARHVWKLNLVKGTEKNWENIYKTYCKWDAVWIFLTHFGDQQCAHSSASAATERMAKLEALQTSLVELLNQKERPLSLHLNSIHNTGEEIKLETTVRQSGSYNYTVQDKHQSHPSASFRTTSSTESINSAPSV